MKMHENLYRNYRNAVFNSVVDWSHNLSLKLDFIREWSWNNGHRASYNRQCLWGNSHYPNDMKQWPSGIMITPLSWDKTAMRHNECGDAEV